VKRSLHPTATEICRAATRQARRDRAGPGRSRVGGGDCAGPSGPDPRSCRDPRGRDPGARHHPRERGGGRVAPRRERPSRRRAGTERGDHGQARVLCARRPRVNLLDPIAKSWPMPFSSRGRGRPRLGRCTG
jgi:hypothetical protein